MNENKGSFIKVCMDNIYYTVKIRLKNETEGENTLARIMIKAEIESTFEREFEKKIMMIINNGNENKGAMQLSSKLISYINSVNARTFSINFRYPLFLERKSIFSNKKYLMKCICDHTISRKSLIQYKQTFKVEVPLIAGQNLIQGTQNKTPEVPVNILVAVEGFETIFAEDIIDVIEDYIGSGFMNLKHILEDSIQLTVLEELKKKLIHKYGSDVYMVKIISQKKHHLYSTETTSISSINKTEVMDVVEEYSV